MKSWAAGPPAKVCLFFKASLLSSLACISDTGLVSVLSLDLIPSPPGCQADTRAWEMWSGAFTLDGCNAKFIVQTWSLEICGKQLLGWVGGRVCVGELGPEVSYIRLCGSLCGDKKKKNNTLWETPWENRRQGLGCLLCHRKCVGSLILNGRWGVMAVILCYMGLMTGHLFWCLGGSLVPRQQRNKNSPFSPVLPSLEK